MHSQRSHDKFLGTEIIVMINSCGVSTKLSLEKFLLIAPSLPNIYIRSMIYFVSEQILHVGT